MTLGKLWSLGFPTFRVRVVGQTHNFPGRIISGNHCESFSRLTVTAFMKFYGPRRLYLY